MAMVARLTCYLVLMFRCVDGLPCLRGVETSRVDIVTTYGDGWVLVSSWVSKYQWLLHSILGPTSSFLVPTCVEFEKSGILLINFLSLWLCKPCMSFFCLCVWYGGRVCTWLCFWWTYGLRNPYLFAPFSCLVKLFGYSYWRDKLLDFLMDLNGTFRITSGVDEVISCRIHISFLIIHFKIQHVIFLS